MAGGDMVETFRDVMRAQQEEVGLLGDVRYIIEALKGLSHTRGTSIQQLAQGHYDEIQQLKRTHGYEMSRLRAQKDKQLEDRGKEAAAETEKLRQEVQTYRNEIHDVKLKHTQQKLSSKLKGGLKLENAVKDIEEKDRTIRQQENTLGYKDWKMANMDGCLSRQYLPEIRNLRIELSAQEDLNANLLTQLNSRSGELDALRLQTSELVDKDAIANILNQEVHEAAYSHVSEEELYWNSNSDTNQQIKALKNICTTRRAGLKTRFDNQRHQSVKIELPLDLVRIAAASKKHQKLVVKEIDKLLSWLNDVTDDLVRKDIGLVEHTERLYAIPWEERNMRLERLFSLADLCGVREQLPSINALGEK